MATVEFQDVTLEVEGKYFLKNVSFRLESGGSMAITGPPGCGRSLVLRLVQGLPGMQKDDKVRLWGDVRINDESVFDMDESGLVNLRLRVGSVMGERELVDNMDVDQNISLALTYHSSNDVEDDDITKRCREAAEWVGVGDLLGTGLRPVQLNQMQRKCIVLARALSLDPEILLLDDICAGIDAQSIDKLLGILTEVKLSHCTRMLTTSRLSTVARAFESYGVLRDGNFFYIRNSDDLIECDDPWIRTELSNSA
ncbi:MAG: ATP-binding cassette domain-containing protein [Candidatus Latescibacterota bacterium]|nr:ATP-binding cassette domain-containing protein [Candidatus Latescibacterota bacterium]